MKKKLVPVASGASLAALVLTAAAPGALAADAATAQATDTGLGEVIVTARKTSERLQDIPLAITAVSAEQLDTNHSVGLEDVAKLTPGLKFTSYLDSVNGNVTIRGLQQENVQNAVGNVGVFLDGIYLQRGFMVDAGLGDYERVEVVKGPQSALYGQNTFAGAVNYVTRKPTDELKFDASATAGNGQLGEGKIGIGGPIVKGILDGRVYAATSDYSGVVRNNYPGATGDSANFGGHKWTTYSGSLKFTPVEQLTITGLYDYSKRWYQINPFYTIDGNSAEDVLNCGPPIAGGGPHQLWCGNFPTDPSAFRSGVGHPPGGLQFLPQPGTNTIDEIGKVAAEYRISDALSINYAYGKTRGSSLEQANFSTDPTAIVGLDAVQREGGVLTYESHEVRLTYSGHTPLTGEVGYLYSRSVDNEAFGLLLITPGPYVSETTNPIDNSCHFPCIVGVPFFKYAQTFVTNSPFGRASYAFLDEKAHLSAELRYTQTKLSYHDILSDQTQTKAGLPLNPVLQATYSNVTPRITGDYKLTPDQLLYVSAARGVKNGGFNGYLSGSLVLLQSQQAFGEESNWTYELGWKSAWLDNTLVFDADFFYVDWKNKQQGVIPSNYSGPPVTTQSAGVVPTIYENVGNATAYGLEVQAAWKPTNHINVNAALSLQNPTFSNGATAFGFVGHCDNVTCPRDGHIGGNEIAQVSKVSGDVGVDYHTTVGSVEYLAGINESYRGSQYGDDVNISKLAAFWLTDAHASMQKGPWKFTLWAKNLFDEKAADAAFVIPVIYQYNVNLIEPRTYGATVSISY